MQEKSYDNFWIYQTPRPQNNDTFNNSVLTDKHHQMSLGYQINNNMQSQNESAVQYQNNQEGIIYSHFVLQPSILSVPFRFPISNVSTAQNVTTSKNSNNITSSSNKKHSSKILTSRHIKTKIQTSKIRVKNFNTVHNTTNRQVSSGSTFVNNYGLNSTSDNSETPSNYIGRINLLEYNSKPGLTRQPFNAQEYFNQELSTNFLSQNSSKDKTQLKESDTGDSVIILPDNVGDNNKLDIPSTEKNNIQTQNEESIIIDTQLNSSEPGRDQKKNGNCSTGGDSSTKTNGNKTIYSMEDIRNWFKNFSPKTPQNNFFKITVPQTGQSSYVTFNNLNTNSNLNLPSLQISNPIVSSPQSNPVSNVNFSNANSVIVQKYVSHQRPILPNKPIAPEPPSVTAENAPKDPIQVSKQQNLTDSRAFRVIIKTEIKVPSASCEDNAQNAQKNATTASQSKTDGNAQKNAASVSQLKTENVQKSAVGTSQSNTCGNAQKSAATASQSKTDQNAQKIATAPNSQLKTDESAQKRAAAVSQLKTENVQKSAATASQSKIDQRAIKTSQSNTYRSAQKSAAAASQLKIVNVQKSAITTSQSKIDQNAQRSSIAASQSKTDENPPETTAADKTTEETATKKTKYKQTINRVKLDKLIQFLKKEEDAKHNEKKQEHSKTELDPNRRKLDKALVVKNKNNLREMVSLLSHKRAEGSKTSQTKTNDGAIQETKTEDSSALINKNTSRNVETHQPEQEEGTKNKSNEKELGNYVRETVIHKTTREELSIGIEPLERGKITESNTTPKQCNNTREAAPHNSTRGETVQCSQSTQTGNSSRRKYNTGSTTRKRQAIAKITQAQDEKTIISLMRAFQKLKTHFCMSCNLSSTTESFWINAISGELRCLNCFKKITQKAEDRSIESVGVNCDILRKSIETCSVCEEAEKEKTSNENERWSRRRSSRQAEKENNAKTREERKAEKYLCIELRDGEIPEEMLQSVQDASNEKSSRKSKECDKNYESYRKDGWKSNDSGQSQRTRRNSSKEERETKHGHSRSSRDRELAKENYKRVLIDILEGKSGKVQEKSSDNSLEKQLEAMFEGVAEDTTQKSSRCSRERENETIASKKRSADVMDLKESFFSKAIRRK